MAIDDPGVRAALSRAGWSVDRNVDTSGWIEQLRSEGFAVTEPAVELLAAVGG
jgi:hypothetical protein